MATLFVTGVSGSLGSHLLPLLASQEGVDVIRGIDSRPLQSSSPKLVFTQVSWADADFDELLVGCDAVIHLEGTISASTLKGLLAASAQARVKQFVMVSTAAVYGAWPNNAVPLQEDAPLRPNNGFPFAVKAAEHERMVAEWHKENSTIDVAVLRMALVLGAGLQRALAAALGGWATTRQMYSSRPVQFLHIDDAVSAIAHTYKHRLDGTFNVAPSDFVGDAQARAVSGILPQPALPRRLAFLLNQWTWRRLYRSDYAAAEPYLEYPWVVSNDRLRAAGWEPSYSSEETLVTEAKPSWWAGLTPSRQRTFRTAFLVGGWALSSTIFTIGLASWLHRWRRET